MPTSQAINNNIKSYENVFSIDFAKNNSYEPIDYRVNSNIANHKIKEVIKTASQEIRNIPSSIEIAINDSKYILNLNSNWDDNGASIINRIAYNKAILFLNDYAERILDVCDFHCELRPPSIVPVRDGSVDLEWNLDNSYLLINFTDSKEDFVYYYLAYKEAGNIIYDANGQVNTKKISDKFAADLVSLS